MNQIKKNLFYILFCIFFIIPGHVVADTSIKIVGNKRISTDTILELINYDKKINTYDQNLLNKIQQDLYSSGFFKNVSTKYNNNILILSLTENPLVDFFYIEGVLNKQREDYIYKKIELGNNKIFSETKLKKDIETVKSIYQESGYIDVVVVPKISQLENNIVNIVLKVERGELHSIKNIFFIGDKYFKSSTLLDSIESSQYGWWKFLSSSSRYSPSRILYDKSLLKNFYLDNGFYDAQIISTDVTVNKNKNVDLVFSISSGILYQFNSAKINDDNNNLSKQDKTYLNFYINKKLKGNYSRKEIFNIKKYIEDYFIEKKIEFLKVDILSKKNLASNNKIDIIFDIKSENKKYVNLINIKGNSITEEKVIRNNLVFSEGDSFANHKLSRSIDNLNSKGLFKTIKPTVIEKDKNLVDLDIKVEEQPTGQISAGVGVGTNETTISAGIQEKNLFGKGINANSALSVGTQKISGNLRFLIPNYGRNENDVAFGLSAIETEYDHGSYKSRLLGTDVAYLYNIYEDITFKAGFGVDNDKISTTTSSSAYLQSLDGSYNTIKGFYSFSNDKRNRKYKTTSGYLVSFDQSIALPGSDIEYLSNSLIGNYYHSISKDYILNLKSGASSINSINNKDIKLSDRLFIPNKNLRGFDTRGVGPKDGDKYIGGNYTAYLNASSTFPNPLPERWNANSILFIDAGNMWGVDYDSSKDISKLRSSAGVAVDWLSPIGPLSFTFAKTLTSADSDNEQSFNFQLGSNF